MFAKKNVTSQLDAPSTVLGRGSILEAVTLSGKDSVRIDGLYRGNIDIDGNLVLGDTGNITGEVRAKYIVIAGRVTGNIYCGSVVHLASTAKVIGDVESKSLVVDEGSQIYGRYTIGEEQDESPEKTADRSYLDKSLELVDNQPTRNNKYDFRANETRN